MLSRQWISSTDKPGEGEERQRKSLVNAWSEQGSWSSVLRDKNKPNKTKQNKNRRVQCLGASLLKQFFKSRPRHAWQHCMKWLLCSRKTPHQNTECQRQGCHDFSPRLHPLTHPAPPSLPTSKCIFFCKKLKITKKVLKMKQSRTAKQFFFTH